MLGMMTETVQTYTSVGSGSGSGGGRDRRPAVGLRRTPSHPDIEMLVAITDSAMPMTGRLGLLVVAHGSSFLVLLGSR